MKKIALLIIILCCFSGFSQEKIRNINIDDIIQQVSEKSEDSDYEKNLELLNKINKNDSAYCSVLTSKSYYLLNLKRFDEAIKVIDEGLQKNCSDENISFFINKVICLLSLEKYEDALQVVDKGLLDYPQNHQLWYNRGYAYAKLGKIKEAIEAYEQTILINPYYKNPHLQLGNICYKQKKMAQALMCYNMYLLLEPDSEEAFTVLNSMDKIISSKNDNIPNPDLQLSADDGAFAEIDLVLSNKIALNDDYKTGNKINIALVRQNHALLEQLKDFEGNGGFWDKRYVPFYKWIVKNNLFDDFTYTLNYSIENEKFKKVIEKNTKSIVAFIELFITKWESVLQKNAILFNGKIQEVTNYYSDGRLQAIGNMEDGKTVGYWEIYDEDGRLTSLANFDKQGEKDGEWKWFFAKDKIKEIAHYKAGKLVGENILNYPNGKIHIKSNYVDDHLDGEYQYYNSSGALQQKKQYKKGELEGLYLSYFDVGEAIVEYHIPYKKGKVDKVATEYYANSDVYSEIPFVNGERNGTEIVYHFNKKPYTEISYKDGELNGSYIVYHKNGNISEVGESKDNFFNGPWKTYYKDGTLESEFVYDKGAINGLYKNYDTDGELYYEYEYRKGEIIAYKFYDKNGEVIKEDRKRGGEFNYTGFSPEGNKSSEGLYDIKGGKSGKWKFYSSNGVLSGEGNFRDNNTEGEYTTYFNNGRKKASSNYENDKYNGYYVDYFLNGQMKNQGYYENDKKYGEWRSYYIDGTLESIYFFHKGQFHGDQEDYSVEGKLERVSYYEFDDLIETTYFDKDGKASEVVDYKPNTQTYHIKFKYSNHNISNDYTYVNGVKHGPYKGYDFNGGKRCIGQYVNGKQDGEWTWYYPNGQPETVRSFLNGNSNGEGFNYYENGKVQNKYYYEYGKTEGTYTTFHTNGKPSIISQYENDELHGRKEFYSQTGKLQMVRFYDHGRLIGYSYLDETSNELPMIPLKKESGLIKAYFDNGKLSREMEFLNGDLVNSYKAYYYTGEIENEITYADDEYNGFDTEYYENGNIKKQVAYLYGQNHGQTKEYYENGKLKKEITYLNDQKSGPTSYYNEQGKLVKKEHYFNGNIYNIETF